MLPYIAMGIIAYFIGSISFGVILTRKLAGFDVRDKGSKGAGTTNVLRTAGKRLAIITLICDALKGVVAILIAMLVARIWVDADANLLRYIAGFFAILGHTFPIFFEFRGGKGVATAIGILLMLNWQIGLTCLVFGIALIIITRMVSVGSMMAALLYPILTLIMGGVSWGAIGFSVLIAALVIFNHRGNIDRLRKGTENKIGQKVK